MIVSADVAARLSGGGSAHELMLDPNARYRLRLVNVVDLDPAYEDVDDPVYVAELIALFRVVGYAARPFIWEPGTGCPDGNHRHLAARRAGLRKVPALVRI